MSSPCRLVLLAALAFAAANAAPASGKDLYVNNLSGADTLLGGDATPSGVEGPVATINQALRLADPGDRIVIANTGEPYREQLALSGCNLHGYDKRLLVIEGNGAMIDGTIVAAEGAWRHVSGDVFELTPRRLTYQQVFRDGKPLTRAIPASGVTLAQALKPLEWTLHTRRLLLRVENGKLPEQYNLRHAGLQTGLTLYNTQNVVVQNLIFQGFQQDGINAHEGVCNCTLRGVECRANGRSGLSAGGTSRLRVESSHFYDNGQTQVRVEGLAKVDLVGADGPENDGAQRYQIREAGQLTVDGARVAP